MQRTGSIVLVAHWEPGVVEFAVYDEAVQPERVEHCGAGIADWRIDPRAPVFRR